MKTTAAKFVSAIFASIIAGTTLAAAPDDEKKTGDNCLLGPSADTPPGGHWYYRIDRANRRNCWYVRVEKDKAARKPAGGESHGSERTFARSPQRSVSDARAELTPPPIALEPDARRVATQPTTAAPADAPRDNPSLSGVNESSPPPSAVASRWLDSSEVAASPAAAPPVPAAPPNEVRLQAAPAAPPQSAAPRARTDANVASEPAPLSLPMLLTILIGALSVLAVIGGTIFGRGNSRSIRLSPSAPMPPFDLAEQPSRDDPRRRIEQMLAQINNRAAA